MIIILRLLKSCFTSSFLNATVCSTLFFKLNPGIIKFKNIHDRGGHWIVASNFECQDDSGTVHVYYSSVNEATNVVIKNLFECCTNIVLIKTQRQVGSVDCGAFAIAIATSILFERQDGYDNFVCQESLRSHLILSFEKLQLSQFPGHQQ